MVVEVVEEVDEVDEVVSGPIPSTSCGVVKLK